MQGFPAQYHWLLDEPGPKILKEALEEYGTIETPGLGNNPVIMSWAHEVGRETETIYEADSVPWCGLFMAVCATRAGFKPPANPLRALAWASFGQAVDKPSLGDVLVFVRQGGGHVGLYVGEDEYAYHVLGGNQSDKVCITRILKVRFYAARRCKWKLFQPKNIRPVHIAASGTISTNEG